MIASVLPMLSLLHVSRSGAISTTGGAANVPYSSVQWTRRFSSPGEFEAHLTVPLPVPWPGRYMVVLDGEEEFGILEKVECDDAGGGMPTLRGRFGESLWTRCVFGSPGGSVAGANWRQAMTAGMAAWRLPGFPSAVFGPGTASPAGSSYTLAGEAGKDAGGLLYDCGSDNSARPAIIYDRGSDEAHVVMDVRTGLDRTRGNAAGNAWAVFGVHLATAAKASYSGDYSTQCSEVIAYAEKADAGDGSEGTSYQVSVPVPGYDADTMWAQTAYEDVSSLLGRDEAITQGTGGNVYARGRLRSYDHRCALAIDAAVYGGGYGEWWDLGDLCEVEVRSLGIEAQARVEEVRITLNARGMFIEVTLGSRTVSRVARYLMGRR